MSTGEPDATEIGHVRFGGGPSEKGLITGTSLAAYPTSRPDLREPGGETPPGHPTIDLRSGPCRLGQSSGAGLDAVLRRVYRSALYPLLTRINAYVMRWLRKKHKRLRGRKKAQEAWNRAVNARPRFFAHWAWANTVPAVW
jgi:hypothetical protein